MMAALNYFLCGERKRLTQTFLCSSICIFFLAIPEARALTLAWDRNNEPNIAGYKLYYGVTNSAATKLDVGNSTSAAVNNLTAGKTYYFYVTAYNTAALESNPSQQITYTVPQPADVTIRWDPSTSTNVAFYTLSWRELYNSTNMTVIKTQNTSYRFPDLKAGTAYFFWANAFDSKTNRLDLYRPTGPIVPAGQSTYWSTRVPALYLSWDGSTGGDWVGQFGKVGYLVASEPDKTSPYFGPINASYVTWPQYSSTGPALQTSDGKSRVAANWYSTNEITVPLNFNDNQIHRLSVYCADFQGAGYQQYIDFVGSNGVVYCSVTIGGFYWGEYLFFDVKGPSTLRIRPKSGNYATLSGLFVD
jgi:hypothetical protein